MDVNIIKQATSELSSIDNSEVVKVAGIIQRVRSWFKSLMDPTYRQALSDMKQESAVVQSHLKELYSAIEKTQKAINEGDIDLYNSSIESVRTLSSGLSSELNSLISISEQTDMIETNQDANISKLDRIVVPSNARYFEYLKKTTESLLRRSNIDKNIIDALIKDDTSFNLFLDEIAKNVSNGNIIKTEQATTRVKDRDRSGELWVHIVLPEFKVPNVPLMVKPIVLITDISIREKNPINEGVLYKIYTLNARQTDSLPEATASIKLAFTSDSDDYPISRGQVKAYNSYPNKHLWARDVLRVAFYEEMGRKGTPAEIQAAQAVSALESNYGMGWKGPGVGSNNWGAVQCRKSQCPPGSFTYTDTSPNSDGTSRKYVAYFKAYPSAIDGAKDVVKNLFKAKFKDRGQKVQSALVEGGSVWDFSAAMYDGGYYEGFGPNRESRIGNHQKAMVKNLDIISKATDEPIAISKDKATDTTKEILSTQPEQTMDNIESIIKYLTSNNNLLSIVKSAIANKVIDKSSTVVRVNNIKFANALSDVLITNFDADVSISSQDNNYDITCKIAASKSATKLVVGYISDLIAKKLNDKYEFVKGSSFDKLSDSKAFLLGLRN